MKPHKQSFVHGYADALAGSSFDFNPYPNGSKDFREWRAGMALCKAQKRGRAPRS